MRKTSIAAIMAMTLGMTALAAGCGPADSGKSKSDPAPAASGATSVTTATASPKVDYPTRGIEYVVPFSAGGGVDLVARTVAEALSKEWGQPVSVVNKPGAGGATGAQYALKQAAADGYTVLADNVSNTTMLAGGFKEPPVRMDDHIFAARIVKDAAAFVVNADAPWKNFKEFSDWVKSNPDKLTWTSVGPAGFSSFVVAEWLSAIQADFTKTRMVTTKGASESLPIVAGGNAVLAVHTVNEVHTLVKAGKLKVLAIQAPERSPYFPDVPTTGEQGVAGLNAGWWTGISFAKGTNPAIIQKWEDALAKLSKDPAFAEKLKNLQLEPAYLSGKEFSDFLKKETDYYTELGGKSGIRK
ncbi:tripartite tricarboxylate transporter substrate binding protein [Gorillibacterium sp. sgz5001074]|uniref:tripartite tricarboxylate transporter substrate binding protein n=1 Tax=Gorillibacterium sp. sgz5001074 TaxID=3446695 RepID=UPI003F66BC99